jgi:hypothetical protein
VEAVVVYLVSKLPGKIEEGCALLHWNRHFETVIRCCGQR